MTGEPGGTGAAGASEVGGWSADGNEVKNSLAMRASSMGSRTPGGMAPLPGKTVVQLPVSGIADGLRLSSFVLMVLSHVYVFEQGDGVVSKHSGRAI